MASITKTWDPENQWTLEKDDLNEDEERSVVEIALQTSELLREGLKKPGLFSDIDQFPLTPTHHPPRIARAP